MIRYKKKRFQQGGTSPAADYAAGAAAAETTYTPITNPYKRMEEQPEKGGGRSGGSGSGIGKGNFNNIIQANPLKSSYLPNLTAKRNETLEKAKQSLVDKFTQNNRYFDTANGLKELNAYKAERMKYQTEIDTIGKSYQNALTRSKGETDRYAFTRDGDVFVNDETNRLQIMSYEEAIKLKYSKENLADNQYVPLRIGDLISSLDNPNQYDNNSILTREVLLDSLNTIVDSKQANTAFLSNIKALWKDSSFDKDDNFVNIKEGKVGKDAILSAKEIEDFKVRGIESTNIRNFIDKNLENPDVEKNFRNIILSNPRTESEIKSGKGGSINDRIRLKAFNDAMLAAETGKAPADPEATKAIQKSRADMAAFAGDNDYNAAETNFGGDATPVSMDINQSYDPETGELKETSSQIEDVFTTNMVVVGSSAQDLVTNATALLEETIKDKELVTLKDFAQLSKVSEVDNAVMMDGTPVSKVDFVEKRNGFVPILGENISVVTMIADTDGNLATWAIPILKQLQQVYIQAEKEAQAEIKAKTSRFEVEKKTEKTTKAVESLVKEKVSAVYDKIAINIPQARGLSYSSFLTNFEYKNFYKVKVVGNIDKDTVFNTDNGIEMTTDELSNNPNAKNTIDKFGMGGQWFTDDHVIMTSVLIPARGMKGGASGKSIYGTAAKDIADMLHSKKALNIQELLGTNTNKALTALVYNSTTE